ncbi:MAG: polynucleotide kinase-phosphatase, partial [Bacteroidota bacterium]
DATNVQTESRKPLVALAREQHCLPVAIVLDIPDKIIRERHATRSDRNFGHHVLNNQRKDLKRSLRLLKKEGFRQVHIIKHPSELDQIKVIREPLWNNKKHLHGPFDIIGDVHGCFTELQALLHQLGYQIEENKDDQLVPYQVQPPSGRKAIFLGDLVDRGPHSPEVLKLVMHMVKNGSALCIPGNHDVKLLKKLRGKQVAIRHGLAETLEQLAPQTPEFIHQLTEFLDGLISHYVLDDGKLVVAHAGLREEMQGRASSQVRSFCLYGETTGEMDEFGLPVRYDWAREYKGKALVVYGHTPIPKPDWLNNTINIDTGCVFGGALTALRYPEKELIRVEAKSLYYEPARPIGLSISPSEPASLHQAFIPDIQDVLGKKYIQTRFGKNITIREENTIAALETMSRFAIDPRRLIYLPPTMSPPEVSARDSYLEHPDEAFAYYQSEGIEEVICEEKHMGSRGIILLFRDPTIAQDRFEWTKPSWGTIHSRTGRRFFGD